MTAMAWSCGSCITVNDDREGRMLTQTEIDRLALKVARAIGEDLLSYTPNQIITFENGMGEVVRLHNGIVDSITVVECIGVHEMVVDHLCPIGLEHIVIEANCIAEEKTIKASDHG